MLRTTAPLPGMAVAIAALLGLLAILPQTSAAHQTRSRHHALHHTCAKKANKRKRQCRRHAQMAHHRCGHKKANCPAPEPAPAPQPAPEPEPEPAPAPAPEPEPAPAPTPSPAPQPSTASWQCGYGGFSAGAWPTACWRPYADSSPMNRPLPPNPRLHPNSANIVRTVLGYGRPASFDVGQAGTPDDWFHPVYYSRSTDPLYTLDCTESWGTCELEGRQIRIPWAARPAAGGDGHMTVVDQAGGWEYDMWQATKGAATVTMSWGGMTRIDGDALGSDANAGQWGLLGGILRASELESGRIDHAMFAVIRCDNGTRVYPAAGQGNGCGTSDAPPMGARFQLAYSDPEIDALPVPAWKKTILRALARYGAYFGDTGGPGLSLVQPESGATYTSFGYEDPFVTFARRSGVPGWNGVHSFDIASAVDWSRLRVVDPCVSLGSC